MPPNGPGSRRAVPILLTGEQRERLRWLLEDPEMWVLRSDWEEFLRTGDRRTLVSTNDLTPDQKVAALSWLRQQRHPLYRALEGGWIAPDGWLDGFELYTRLSREAPGG